MKKQARIDPRDAPPRSEQRVPFDLARLENGVGDLDRHGFASTRMVEHVRNRHRNDVWSRRRDAANRVGGTTSVRIDVDGTVGQIEADQIGWSM
jgi:hypothetical protein